MVLDVVRYKRSLVQFSVEYHNITLIELTTFSFCPTLLWLVYVVLKFIDMTDLVFKGENNQALTSSLLVAEKFGKRHANVIRDIEKLLNTEDEELNSKMSLAFVSSTYVDSTGKGNLVYIMNRKGFSILVMGYNGIKALKFKNDFYDAFENLETRLKEQQKPLSTVQMFALQANINLEHEQRLINVEQKLDALAKEREENTRLLLSVSVSAEKVPEISLRDKIRQLVNKYSSATNINQRDVWHKVYEQLYYRYHISINSYTKRDKRETNLDVAERNGLLDKIYTIISSLIRDSKQIA